MEELESLGGLPSQRQAQRGLCQAHRLTAHIDLVDQDQGLREGRQEEGTHRASAGSGAGRRAGRGRLRCASVSCGLVQTSGRHFWCQCGPGGVPTTVKGVGSQRAEEKKNQRPEDTISIFLAPSVFRDYHPGARREELVITQINVSSSVPLAFFVGGGVGHPCLEECLVIPIALHPRCQWCPPTSLPKL